MKKLAWIIAWIGIFLVIPGLVFSFSSSWELAVRGNLGSGVGYFLTAILGGLGIILAIIGGLSARPRFFWILAITIGIVYLASFYGLAFAETRSLSGWIVILLPGFAFIVLGIIIHKTGKRKTIE